MRRTSVSRKQSETMSPILPLPTMQRTSSSRSKKRWLSMLPRINRPSPRRLLVLVLGLSFFVTLLVEIFHLKFHGYDSHSGIRISQPLFLMSRPKVTLAQGIFKGTTVRGTYPQTIDSFLGIPYARSTAGKNRFKPPVALAQSTYTFDASEYGPRCPSTGDDEVRESEDCLNLNVFRPHGLNPKTLVPVAVYIHGGAFNFGSGKARAMANMVAWAERPMIAVSFNYRLGALGFLSGRWAGKDGVLNVGLKDQAMLLEWVKNNINAFGGDPERVTLIGDSAGAHSVGHHLLGLDQPRRFNQVIMESGAPTARAVRPYDHELHEQQFRQFLDLMEVSHVTDTAMIERLQSIPLETIKAASERVFNDYDTSLRWPWQPVIDGKGGMIPLAPIERWNSGEWHKVTIMTGFNENEGSLFVPENITTTEEFDDFFLTLIPGLDEDDLATLNELYPDPQTSKFKKYEETRPGLGKQFKRTEAAYCHYAYAAPVRHTAYFARKTPTNPNVYLYRWALEKSLKGGAAHGDQSEYITYNDDVVQLGWRQKELSGFMLSYWTSFIVTGNPNELRERWPHRRNWGAFGVGGSSNVMVIGSGNNQRAGGGDSGLPAQEGPDKWAERESNFWWSKVDLSES